MLVCRHEHGTHQVEYSAAVAEFQRRFWGCRHIEGVIDLVQNMD